MTSAKGQAPHRGKTVTNAELAQMWDDRALTYQDIADMLNITKRSLYQRAKTRGLPDRRPILWAQMDGFDEQFPMMWRGCVRSDDIARHYGRSIAAVEKKARQLGVRRGRKVNRHHPGITMELYQAVRLRLAMTCAARIEQAAMINAELVDRVSDNNWVGIRQARGQA